MWAIDLFQCPYLFFRTQVTLNAQIFVFKLHVPMIRRSSIILFLNFWILVPDLFDPSCTKDCSIF